VVRRAFLNVRLRPLDQGFERAMFLFQISMIHPSSLAIKPPEPIDNELSSNFNSDLLEQARLVQAKTASETL